MKLLCLVLALIAAVPRISFADDETILWKEVGGWNVAVDKTLGNACFVMTSFEDGTVFRLGFNFIDEDNPFYILIANANWKSLEEGKQYPIEFYLDRSKWTVDASAVDFDGNNALWINFKDTSLIGEFALKLSFRANFNGKRIVALSLKNSVSRRPMRCSSVKRLSMLQWPNSRRRRNQRIHLRQSRMLRPLRIHSSFNRNCRPKTSGLPHVHESV